MWGMATCYLRPKDKAGVTLSLQSRAEMPGTQSLPTARPAVATSAVRSTWLPALPVGVHAVP